MKCIQRWGYTLSIGCFCALVGLISGCESSTSSGVVGANRKQFLLLESTALDTESAQMYRQLIQQAQDKGSLNRQPQLTQRVRRIADRLIAQVGVFRPDAKRWHWQVNVIQSPDLNAFCMPGGKIAVYSGLISTLQLNDDQLAAVIGHEIAHALREHTREQLSQEIAKQQGIALIGQMVGLSADQMNLANWLGELGLNLPFSRKMETEADIMGLELMARAGYNPEAAVQVWQKMQSKEGQTGFTFLSTHPSNQNRIQVLQNEIVKVMPLYRQASRARF